MSQRIPAYLSAETLAAELEIAESTVYELVRRGVLPPPIRLSPRCARWSWADVERALDGMRGAGETASDPYLAGAKNVEKSSEGGSETSDGRP